MNKKELIANVAKKTMRTQKEVQQVIDTAFGEIGDAMASEQEVVIKDFGRFHTYISKQRKGIEVYSQKTN